MRKVGGHLQHYLPLLGILLAGIVGFSIFSYDKTLQSAVVISAALSYVVWGIVHHHIHRNLHLSVVVEYLAIAALGVVVIFSLLFRA